MNSSNTSRARRYAVIGTGAVGGYYGGLLAKAGLEVHFLLRGDYGHVVQHGLVVESKNGDFRLPKVNAYAQAADMPPADVVLVALKTTHNHLLASLLPPVLNPDSAVVLLQNGLGVEEEAARVAGPDGVLGGLCFLCSNKIGPGHFKHLDYGLVTLGEFSPTGAAVGVTDRMRAIASDFEWAGIAVTLAEDLLTARWQKLLWNIPFSGLSVALDATTDEIMNDPAAHALAESIMREVHGAASRMGRAIDESFLRMMLANTARMPPYKTSMKIDYEQKRPLELEAILGNPLRAAQAAGADCARLEMLYRSLQFLDARNRA